MANLFVDVTDRCESLYFSKRHAKVFSGDGDNGEYEIAETMAQAGNAVQPGEQVFWWTNNYDHVIAFVGTPEQFEEYVKTADNDEDEDYEEDE